MTLVEFNENLNKIDFKKGANIETLDNYLLACLAQLNRYKNKEPSYELFLVIFDQARNGPREDFDSSWKASYVPEEESESDDLAGWKRLRDGIRFLTADLIHTKVIRSHPDYIEKVNLYEWDSEGGIRFYNGTTPDAILGYAATRFEGEYDANAFQNNKVTWQEFSYPIWVGISYE